MKLYSLFKDVCFRIIFSCDANILHTIESQVEVRDETDYKVVNNPIVLYPLYILSSL